MTTKITVSRPIKATPQKIWEYYTVPTHITRWNFAHSSWHCPSVKNDLRIGGKYFARMEARDGSFGFDYEGTYTSLTPGEKFSYTFDDKRSVDIKIEPNGDETNIVVVFDPEENNPIEMQKQGWQAILDNFGNYVENN